MNIKTYDPAKVLVIVAGNIISGFAPGVFIQLSEDQPMLSDDFGCDGESARWLPYAPFSTLVLTLAPTAGANTTLSNLLNLDRFTQAAIFPVIVQDSSNPTDTQPPRIVAGRGWLRGFPVMTYQNGVPVGRPWTLRLLDVVFDAREVGETPALTASIS